MVRSETSDVMVVMVVMVVMFVMVVMVAMSTFGSQKIVRSRKNVESWEFFGSRQNCGSWRRKK